MNKVIRTLLGPSLLLWPLFALVASGMVVLGKAIFYPTAWGVLVVWPLIVLAALWRLKAPRIRVYVACLWLVIGFVLVVWRVPALARDYDGHRQTDTQRRIESSGKSLWLAWERFGGSTGNEPANLEQLVDSVPISEFALFPFERGLKGSDITRRNRPADLSARCPFEYVRSAGEKNAKDRVLFRLKKGIDGLGTAEVLQGGDIRWKQK